MAEIKKDNLEKALSMKEGKKEEKKEGRQEMPKEMEIGFHQGALNTLLNERNELIRMIQQVEVVMQAHMKRLEELGIKIKMSSEKKE
ncbi:MAG: hypothetical protein NTU63_03670 [Candidatus Pacearchaeota archaeon]|nr:hypothetical protein [Candidatus Pacearchaeota archaeon]